MYILIIIPIFIMYYLDRKINFSVYYLRKRSHITIVYSCIYAIHNLMNHEHNNYNYNYSNIIIQKRSDIHRYMKQRKCIYVQNMQIENVLQIKTVL